MIHNNRSLEYQLVTKMRYSHFDKAYDKYRAYDCIIGDVQIIIIDSLVICSSQMPSNPNGI
jgi:hypothetical protein